MRQRAAYHGGKGRKREVGFACWLRVSVRVGVGMMMMMMGIGIGIGIGEGLDAKPAKDLVFLPFGVADGERGRLEPDEEVDIVQEKLIN